MLNKLKRRRISNWLIAKNIKWFLSILDQFRAQVWWCYTSWLTSFRNRSIIFVTKHGSSFNFACKARPQDLTIHVENWPHEQKIESMFMRMRKKPLKDTLPHLKRKAKPFLVNGHSCHEINWIWNVRKAWWRPWVKLQVLINSSTTGKANHANYQWQGITAQITFATLQ